MKNVFSALCVLMFAKIAMAQAALPQPKHDGPCVNQAKYGAMKAYRSGQQQGEGLSIVASLSESKDSVYTYSISIDEMVSDGADDSWANSIYVVEVRALDSGKCEVVSVTESENP